MIELRIRPFIAAYIEIQALKSESKQGELSYVIVKLLDRNCMLLFQKYRLLIVTLNIDLANLYAYAIIQWLGQRGGLISSRLKHCIIFIIDNVVLAISLL